MNTLECSSKGDKRFSAFYAYIDVNGIITSIEHHYQDCKYKDNDAFGERCKKGEPVDFIIINGKKMNAEYLTPFYKLLWYKYFKKNPQLLEYAKKFDKFNDMFRGKSVNCQADVIEYLATHTKEEFLAQPDIIEFLNILKE
jgi:hypothetical protein